MSEQPEALRLADDLEAFAAHGGGAMDKQAAAELRRQHAEIQQLNAQVYLQMKWKTEAQDENERLLEVNAKLVEALTDLLGWQTLAPDDVVAAARDALAKAEEVNS